MFEVHVIDNLTKKIGSIWPLEALILLIFFKIILLSGLHVKLISRVVHMAFPPKQLFQSSCLVIIPPT